MTPIILFIISIALGVGCSVGYKLGAQREEKAMDIPFLLLFEPFILAMCFLVASLSTELLTDIKVVLPAMLSGVSTFAAMFCLFKSMGKGSFGVTTVLANMSFVIPIVLSLTFLNETASIFQLCGMLVIILAITIVNINTGTENKGNINKTKKWDILWAVAACVFNGLINFGLKLNQFYLPGTGQISFNFFLFLFCGCCALIYAIFVKIKTRTPVLPVKKQLLPLGVLVVCCGVNFYIQSLLPQYVNATVQFTVCIGGALLAGILLSHLYYKERFTWRSAVTVVGSVAAILLQII